MVDGIREALQRDDFIIDMQSFGHHNGQKICFGCAATCAIQNITGIQLNASNIYLDMQHFAFNIDKIIIQKFETAIDSLRRGYKYGTEEWEFHFKAFLENWNVSLLEEFEKLNLPKLGSGRTIRTIKEKEYLLLDLLPYEQRLIPLLEKYGW